MVNKYPSVQCPVTGSLCSDCFKYCSRHKALRVEVNPDQEHRDDAKVLEIIVEAITEFHHQCGIAAKAGAAVASAHLELGPIEGQLSAVTLALITEMQSEQAQVIVKHLLDKGFAVGMFR